MTSRVVAALAVIGMVALMITSVAFQALAASPFASGVSPSQEQTSINLNAGQQSGSVTILNVTWQIDVVNQLVVGAGLYIQPDAASPKQVDYLIRLSISCQHLGNGHQYFCASGSSLVTFQASETLPQPLNVTIKLSHPIDPENVEIHDLGVMVTSHP